MKTLVIYDSQYGNTEKIAQAIGGAIAGDVQVLRVTGAVSATVDSVDLLIIGSPTQGGRPTKPIQEFIDNLPENTLKGKSTAAFDTRLQTKLVGIFGYAAGKIADSLKKKGANVLAAEGFFVGNKENSIKEGELERAVTWAKWLVQEKS